MLVQRSFLSEFFPTTADVFYAEVTRVDMTNDVLFRAERLRTVGTHETLLSIDEGRRELRNIKNLQQEKRE